MERERSGGSGKLNTDLCRSADFPFLLFFLFHVWTSRDGCVRTSGSFLLLWKLVYLSLGNECEKISSDLLYS